MKKFIYLMFLLLFVFVEMYGQGTNYQLGLTQTIAIPVINNADTLTLGWAGGLNSPQFSSIDLNDDGVPDIFIFDRSNNKCYTFVNADTATGHYHYQYAPQYEKYFPTMQNWCLLRDYNGDGKEDIFTSTAGGIKVYKNITVPGQQLQFTLLKPLLLFKMAGNNSSNIYVPSTNVPFIGDLDYDGDLDILTAGLYGSFVECYKNMGIDYYGNADSLVYKEDTICWGHINMDDGLNVCPTSANLFDTCNAALIKAANTTTTHQKCGTSKSLLALHVNGDSAYDLLMGSNTCNNLAYMQNDTLGYQYNTSMVYEDDSFPKNYNNTLPVNIPDFPAAYSIDIDNNQTKDLIVATNEQYSSIDYNSVWYYKNNGDDFSPDYSLLTKGFLQRNMIDVGTGASPALADINRDGLLDLIIGNYSYYDSSGAQLAYYKNIGTSTNPEFKLISLNFGHINAYNLNIQLNEPATNISPTFGDINNDGVLDMIVGDGNGYVHWFTVDSNGITLVQAAYDSINVGGYAYPQLVDLNNDGLLDLVIGNQSGKIYYYKNTGTATNPSFMLTTNHLGNVNTTPWSNYNGYCSPYFYKIDNHFRLICGTNSGYLFYYTNIDGNLAGTFTKADTTYENIYGGYNSLNGGIKIAGGDFIGADGIPDIIIGEFTGGLISFSGDTIPSTEGIRNQTLSPLQFKIYPNPASNQLNITYTKSELLTAEIYSLTGQLLLKSTIKAKTQLDISELPDGVYFILLTNKQGLSLARKKFVVMR